ncbi:hypothetical protein Athai_24710 [Actinocatenispora thailandica]|uniref:Uncharacterized protein n=1 Tax=Actinocatenispora thailandica TaxID=227318 RepID=A0A7R7HWK1_9ACTN|nr:hypothetical protein [Actinocatenispora thailandica]BCJ34968.1 hypothetical protein Athai_24710 [Actinocatenispora thailandica]
MIIASLLLILIAAVLLVLGLLRGVDLLLVVSIAVSLLAAVALYLGARRSHADHTDDTSADPEDERQPAIDPPSVVAHSGAAPRDGSNLPPRRVPASADDERPPWPLDRATAPADDEPGRDTPARAAAAPDEAWSTDRVDEPDDPSDDPLDEPPVQRTPRSDAELIARLPAEVLVVDGRPRYHVTGCPHLLDKEAEPLPVAEAVELGFGPCGWCQPDTVLLGGTPDLA